MIGGVMIERTVKEILPDLEEHRSNINEALKTLLSQYQSKVCYQSFTSFSIINKPANLISINSCWFLFTPPSLTWWWLNTTIEEYGDAGLSKKMERQSYRYSLRMTRKPLFKTIKFLVAWSASTTTTCWLHDKYLIRYTFFFTKKCRDFSRLKLNPIQNGLLNLRK
jgi:hypothetical protein